MSQKISMFLEEAKSVIEEANFLQKAFRRGKRAADALQNGRQGIGVPLIVEIAGLSTNLGEKNPEKTIWSYAQMLSILKRQMREEGKIRGIDTCPSDIDALTAQSLGVFESIRFSKKHDKVIPFLEKAIFD